MSRTVSVVHSTAEVLDLDSAVVLSLKRPTRLVRPRAIDLTTASSELNERAECNIHYHMTSSGLEHNKTLKASM